MNKQEHFRPGKLIDNMPGRDEEGDGNEEDTSFLWRAIDTKS